MNKEEVQSELQRLIENLVGTKVAVDESLIESRLIDSMGVIDLTLEIEEAFKIKIIPAEVRVENFENINLLSNLILSKKC